MRIATTNIIFLGIGLIIMAIVGLFNINFLDYKAPIPYSDWEQIIWTDFKGWNRPFRTLDGSAKFAFISTEIVVNRTAEGNLQVTTYFHPSRSYVFNQNVMQKSLLKHELYHLHITESVARQMREQLTNHKNTSDREIATIEEQFNHDEDDLQRAYDLETEHGFRLGFQKKWEARIDSSLNAMNDFSNPVIP